MNPVVVAAAAGYDQIPSSIITVWLDLQPAIAWCGSAQNGRSIHGRLQTTYRFANHGLINELLKYHCRLFSSEVLMSSRLQVIRELPLSADSRWFHSYNH